MNLARVNLARLSAAWMAAPPQRHITELLDLGAGTERQVRRSLADIARINRFLGGNRASQKEVWRLLKKSASKRAVLLDVGTGRADLPRAYLRRAARCGFDLNAIGLDISSRHLAWAQRHQMDASTQHTSVDVPLVAGDAFRLPLADGSVDVVTSSLFLHHFSPEEIVQLLEECGRVARRGWVMNDIVRGYVPLWFFRLVRPVFATSTLTRHDGEASLRRAYTLQEMQQMCCALPGVEVRPYFPFRMCVVLHKPGGYRETTKL